MLDADSQPPAIEVLPGAVFAGELVINSKSMREFSVRNIGGGTLSGNATVPAPFFVSGTAGYQLKNGERATIVVGYAPVPGTLSQPVADIGFSGGGDALVTVTGVGQVVWFDPVEFLRTDVQDPSGSQLAPLGTFSQLFSCIELGGVVKLVAGSFEKKGGLRLSRPARYEAQVGTFKFTAPTSRMQLSVPDPDVGRFVSNPH